MASTSKNWIGANSWVSCRLVVTSTPNATGNYSDVTAQLFGARNDGGNSYNHSSSHFWININGTQTSRGGGCQVSGSSLQLVHSQTTRVYHNDDGSKTITVSAGGGITDTTFQMGSNSVSLTLDKIARKSTLTVEDGVLGTSLAITINRQNDKYTDTITYKCGEVSGAICESTSELSITWTPPIELAEQNTSGTTVTVEFTVETFNDSTSLGTNTKKITCTIPDTVVPTVEISEHDMMSYFEKYGAYVQGKSVLAIDLVATGVYGSTIATYSTTVDGKTYTTSTITVSPIATHGELGIEVTVTDSRGRKGTANKTISVLEYTQPKLVDVSSKRCDADGTSNSSGEYLKVSFKGNVTALNDKNSATYKVEYKKKSESVYTSQILTDYTGKYGVSEGAFIFSADKYSSYDISVSVYDDLNNFTKLITGSSVRKVFSILAKGLGFALGKVAELEGVFEVAFKTKHTGGLLYPVLISGTDIDSVKTPNTYVLKSNNAYTNVPANGIDAILDVVGEEDGKLLQRLKIFSAFGSEIYERIFETETWSEWVSRLGDLVDKHNEFVELVMDDSTIESDYVVLPNGLTMCWGVVNVKYANKNVLEGMVNFPIEFKVAPTVSCTIITTNATGELDFNVKITNLDTKRVGIYVHTSEKTFSATSNKDVQWIAIGY